VAKDDWRIRIDLEAGGAHGFMEGLRHGLGSEAKALADELRHHRLSVSRDDDVIYVYADSADRARIAHSIVEAELERHGTKAGVTAVEHWLADEGRWDDEPPGETWEEEHAERGYAPYEVRVECASPEEAETLADALAGDGYEPIRQHRYVIVGAASEDDAKDLARRTHGEVELGGEVVYEVSPGQPFAFFG
jgi:hypothetical protein